MPCELLLAGCCRLPAVLQARVQGFVQQHTDSGLVIEIDAGRQCCPDLLLGLSETRSGFWVIPRSRLLFSLRQTAACQRG